MPSLEAVIGLEVHVHLNTLSKLFCGCKNVSEAEKPNQFVCPVCMGYPGTLPALNRQAVEDTILAGLALGCTVAEHCTFARKSYFYPDLPKGYQISQYEEPLCVGGEAHVYAGDTDRVVHIQRVHLEEDAAKNMHVGAATLVDFNRAGTPLIEIVTAPDLRSPAEAKVFLEDLQRTMRYLDISNADMENGDLRVDANVSLRQHEAPSTKSQAPMTLTPKTEVKNLNSFRSVERALAYEIERQTKLWDAGTPPAAQGTRGWDDAAQQTVERRVKEGEADYRYFPEPDIPPLHIAPELVQKLRAQLPELPHDKEERLRRQYRLPQEQARILVGDRQLAAFAENLYSEIDAWEQDRADVQQSELPHLIQLGTNYLLGDVRTTVVATGSDFGATKITPENLAELTLMLHRGEINRTVVPAVLRAMHATGGDPSTIVREHGLGQVSDADELQKLVLDTIAAFPAEVDKIRAGQTRVVEFLVGQVMAKTKGRANPAAVRDLMQRELGS